MGKLRFPKEKPDVAQKLDESVKLLEQSADDPDKLLRAFNNISQCAKEGSARANFLKACILYVDETETGESREEILSLLAAAEKAKYPLASGMKIDYLSGLDDDTLLYDVLRKCKGDSPQSLYCEGGFLAGLCTLPYGLKKNLEKSAECFERSAQMYIEYNRAYREGCRELADIALCTRNDDFFTSQAAYAYQMLMYVYGEMNAKSNVQKYITAYANAQKYGNSVVIYKTAAQRATDCMNNVMGMHSLKTVNSVLKTAKAAYARLDEAQRERLEENYNDLWELYEEFYEFEKERLEALGNTDIYTSPDYAKQDTLVADVASAVQNAVQRWAESGNEKKEYTVTVDNKEYKLNDLGEMVDEYGQGNGLKVDTTSKRVYNENNDAIGYFDSLGLYHKY